MEESGDIEIVQSGSIMSNKSCPSLRNIGIDQDPRAILHYVKFDRPIFHHNNGIYC